MQVMQELGEAAPLHVGHWDTQISARSVLGHVDAPWPWDTADGSAGSVAHFALVIRTGGAS